MRSTTAQTMCGECRENESHRTKELTLILNKNMVALTVERYGFTALPGILGLLA